MEVRVVDNEGGGAPAGPSLGLVRAWNRMAAALARLRERLGALGDASHELRHDERIAEMRLRQQHPYY